MVRVDTQLMVKIAAFCRELGDDLLSELAREHGDEAQAAYRRAEEALRSGRTGPDLEADLDALHDMVQRFDGQGLYPSVTRAFRPLPGLEDGTGAQWWGCPGGRCAGRGRVRPGQQPPVCAATGNALTPGPLPR